MDGFEYLDMLAEQKEKPPGFSAFTEFLDAKAREQGIPLHGQLELTPLCNLECRMCYVHLQKEQMKGRKLLSVSQWKDLIRQAVKAGMFQATLTGGECLTYPGFKEVYLYLQSIGCQISVLTNGVLLDEGYVQFFREHPPTIIQITLYGQNEEVYERAAGQRVFARVAEHIRLLREAGVPLVLSITPNACLGEDVFETIRLARSLCPKVMINTSLFAPREETGRSGQQDDLSPEFYARIFRLRNQLYGRECAEVPLEDLPEPGGPHEECTECGLECGGGRSGFLIDWKGSMRPCNRLGIERYPLQDGFEEAWRQINDAVKQWPRTARCIGCAYEDVCDKCAARMIKFAQPGKQPIAYCEQIRYYAHRGIVHVPSCVQQVN